MKLNNLKFAAQHEELLKHHDITVVYNNYIENINKLPFQLELFALYNIKGNEHIFIGTFEHYIEKEDEYIVMYVFLVKNNFYAEENLFSPKIYTCYELIYFNSYEKLDKSYKNIRINEQSTEYNKFLYLLKNK